MTLRHCRPRHGWAGTSAGRRGCSDPPPGDYEMGGPGLVPLPMESEVAAQGCVVVGPAEPAALLQFGDDTGDELLE